LEKDLVDICALAGAAWPGLALPAEVFARHVRERLPPGTGGPDMERTLPVLHLSDLYLACACIHGVPGAAAALEREFLSKVPPLLSRKGRSQQTIDEVCQKLRETLLIQSHLATYSGEGRLWSWIEVIAKRMANREDRARGGEAAPVSGVVDLLQDSGDPEADAIKRKHLQELQEAMRAAGSALSDEQREMLRFHYRNGLSESKLAKLFNTSQPTISRRLSKAKELILTETQRALRQRLDLSEADFESFIGEIRSRWLDLSLSHLFGGADATDPPSL
jgi:RNA polymerase sigma-70 factor